VWGSFQKKGRGLLWEERGGKVLSAKEEKGGKTSNPPIRREGMEARAVFVSQKKKATSSKKEKKVVKRRISIICGRGRVESKGAPGHHRRRNSREGEGEEDVSTL